MVGNAGGTAKAQIGQHDALVMQAFNQRMKVLIMSVHGGPIPVDDLSLRISQPAQFDTHAPAPFVFALLAHLSGTAALTDRKEPFNRITVDDGKETGLSEESTNPVLVGLQLPLQARSNGQACKQVIVIALDPAGNARNMSHLR